MTMRFAVLLLWFVLSDVAFGVVLKRPAGQVSVDEEDEAEE